MLNRRHLRIKVFQAIYSYLKGSKSDLGVGEKELMSSIDRIYELFITHLSVLTELHRFAEKQIEDRKLKRLPTEEDLNPNLKFVESKLLSSLVENEDLQKKIEEYKISWVDHDDLIKNLFNSIAESKEYNKFMAVEGDDFASSQDLLVKLYKNFIADNDLLQSIFEEKSIHWSDDHYFVCGYVAKFLKNYKEKFKFDRKIPALYKDLEDDTEFVKILFRQTLLKRDEYQEIIMEKAKNWEADRIAVVDFILMKMAVCELIQITSVPVKVTLNEYIELSKSYSTPKSRLFINGVLDKIVPDLTSQGKIQKVGRGLMN